MYSDSLVPDFRSCCQIVDVEELIFILNCFSCGFWFLCDAELPTLKLVVVVFVFVCFCFFWLLVFFLGGEREKKKKKSNIYDDGDDDVSFVLFKDKDLSANRYF